MSKTFFGSETLFGEIIVVVGGEFCQDDCGKVATLANLSPDSGNLANFESDWLQIFWFGDLANFWPFLKSI